MVFPVDSLLYREFGDEFAADCVHSHEIRQFISMLLTYPVLDSNPVPARNFRNHAVKSRRHASRVNPCAPTQPRHKPLPRADFFNTIRPKRSSAVPG